MGLNGNGHGLERRLQLLEEQLVDRVEWELAEQLVEHLGLSTGEVGEIIEQSRRLTRVFGVDADAMTRYCTELVGCSVEEFVQECREAEAWLDAQEVA